MRKIHKKATAIILVMVMVLGGLTGLITPGGSKAYAADPTDVTISDENITNVVTSSDHKTVTLTTNEYMALKSGVSVTEAVYVTRTGPDGFVNVGTDSPDNVVIVAQNSNPEGAQTVFTLTFDVPLTATANLIQIQGQYFESQDGGQVVGNATIQPLDLQPPAYVGSNSYGGNDVTLYFDENITLNNVEDLDTALYLQSKLSISTNGVDFVALPKLMNAGYHSKDIYLNYDNYDMKVILGANTRIKIASDTFKDVEGNSNSEMILDINPPIIQSAAISDANKTVTITYNESVSENTNSTNGNLKDYIYLWRNGDNSNYLYLSDNDSVSFSDGKLVINFDQALVGTNIQIVIGGNALKDNAGNVENKDTITPFIQAGAASTDTTAPKLLNYYLSSDKMDLTFVFDEAVESNTVDFNSSIYRYDVASGWGYGINGTVEFSENTVILHFDTSRTGYQYYYSIKANSLRDKAGNILSYEVNMSNWIYPQNPLTFNNGYISLNGRLLNLYFNSDIKDNTFVAGVSHLKEKIKVSTDQGVNFLPLAAEDVVTIEGNRMLILFHDAKKSGSIHVQVDAGALSNLHINGVQNSAIDTIIAYNTPDVKGYFFSNAASEFLFEDDGVWSTKVRNVTIRDNNNGIDRQLSSSEYTLAAGKLTINQGVFQEGFYYYMYIEADGYSSKEIRGEAFTSSKLFYMTAPVINKLGGIMAKVNILRNNDIRTNSDDYGLTQTVVFELMDGTTPVSIVASELDVYTGAYSAQFNVLDGATNSNYTVRAFVVSNFSNDYTNVGMNLTTEVTQTEFDLKLNEYYND